MTAQNEIKWDGKVYPYVPSDPLKVDPRISFHQRVAQDLDPISFEVIRYAMWNINVEQGNTLLRVSGSPIAAYGHDFNPCLLDEAGDFVFFGPFLQYLSSASGSAVKWTLEHRSSNPGIDDGDIFLTNDPWVGAIHQADVCIFAPLFWKGELFCWFEKGLLRKDLEEEYIRRSRMPDLVALDLHAQITACNVARDRMQRLIEKYGPEVVKAVMKRLQDNSEASFVQRLGTIPDGTWAEESFVELSREGDRHVYRNVVRLTKKGDRLIFDNEGTAPQIGSINCAAIAWKGAIASMISAQMLFDQMFVIEGAYRHMEFKPAPGTLTCAMFPAGVVSAPPTVLLQTIGLAGLVISRMLYCSSDETLQKEVQSCMGTLCFPIDAIAGIDQRGDGFASFILDPVGGALGALSWKDGVNTGGWPWDLQSTMPNVEDNEIFYPLLYLWRKEIPNSGGAGKFRGGNAAEIAYVVNDSDSITHYTTGGHTIIPGPSLFGGDPTSRTRYMMIRKAAVRETAARDGKMPADLDDLAGEHTNVSPKTGGIVQETGDVFSLAWTSAAGFGDPLERDPQLVVQDIENAYISIEWATQRYGVCLDENGVLDTQKTESLRKRIIGKRLSAAAGSEAPLQTIAEAPGDIRVSEGLVIAKTGEEAFYTCTKCRTRIQNADENYKSGCITRVTNVKDVGLSPIDPGLFIDDEIEYREYFCPGCGLLLQGNFTRPEDPDFRDTRLASARSPHHTNQADD